MRCINVAWIHTDIHRQTYIELDSTNLQNTSMIASNKGFPAFVLNRTSLLIRPTCVPDFKADLWLKLYSVHFHNKLSNIKIIFIKNSLFLSVSCTHVYIDMRQTIPKTYCIVCTDVKHMSICLLCLSQPIWEYNYKYQIQGEYIVCRSNCCETGTRGYPYSSLGCVKGSFELTRFSKLSIRTENAATTVDPSN